MAIKISVIENISNQSIGILYESGDPNNAAGDVAATDTGILGIRPNKKISIETSRIDIGQLSNLSEKNLIKVTNTLA